MCFPPFHSAPLQHFSKFYLQVAEFENNVMEDVCPVTGSVRDVTKASWINFLHRLYISCHKVKYGLFDLSSSTFYIYFMLKAISGSN